MGGDVFKQIVEKLNSASVDSWIKIHAHIGLVLSSWARKELIELDWVASEERIQNSRTIHLEVYSRFYENFSEGQWGFTSYSGYKTAVIHYTEEILKDRFSNFYALIRNKDNKAWQKVNERLYVYAAKCLSTWLIKPELANKIYQDSVVRLYKRVTTKDLVFTNSRDFKRYFFKILELYAKTKLARDQIQRPEKSGSASCMLVKAVSQDTTEQRIKHYYVTKIMNESLVKEDALILKQYYFKGEELSNIADSLKISEEECRQKKLQALLNISTLLQEINHIRKHT